MKVTPWEIRVIIPDGSWSVKNRHSKVSDFSNDENLEKQAVMDSMCRQASLVWASKARKDRG